MPIKSQFFPYSALNCSSPISIQKKDHGLGKVTKNLQSDMQQENGME
jgi:hypothetical protein